MKRAGDGENNFSTPPPKFVPVMMPMDGTDFYGSQWGQVGHQWGGWHGPPGPRGMPHMRGFHPREGQMRSFSSGPNRAPPPGPHGYNYNNYHSAAGQPAGEEMKPADYDARDVRHQDAQMPFKNTGNSIRLAMQRETTAGSSCRVSCEGPPSTRPPPVQGGMSTSYVTAEVTGTPTYNQLGTQPSPTQVLPPASTRSALVVSPHHQEMEEELHDITEQGDEENNFLTQPQNFVPVMMPMDEADFYGGQWGGWHGPPGHRGMPHMRGFHPRRGQMRFFAPGPNRGRLPGPHGFNNYNSYHRRPWVHMRPPPPVAQLIPVPVPVQQADHWGGIASVSGVMPMNGPSALNESGEKKKKKKAAAPIQVQQQLCKWNLEDAQKALEAEQEYHKTCGRSIIIRFPDIELSKEIVRRLHSSIDSVHFQVPSSSRYCFAQLVDDAKLDQTISEIEKIPFGNGMLKADKKVEKEEVPTTPQSLDPFSLYLGNLPKTITSNAVKEQFPTAYRIDVGYAQKMKFTRYAFIKFMKAEDALKAYKNSVNLMIQNRSIILRFRRHKGPVGPPGEVCKQEMNAEKLSVGAKMKAKKDKLKAEREANGEIVEDEGSDISEDDISDDDDYIDDEYLEKHIKFENDDVESEDEDKDEDDDEDDDVQCNIAKETEEYDNTDDIFNGLGDCDWTNIVEVKPGQ